MRKTLFRRMLFLTLVAVLALAVTFGVRGAKLMGDVNGDGKISVFDAQLLIEQRLMVRELTISQQENQGTATLEDIIQMILNGQTTAVDPSENPNNIAKIENGEEITYATTVAEMTAAIASDGQSVVTLLKDITHESVIKLPYSCQLNLDGHTITTNQTSGNGLQILAAGSVNKVTTIAGGTLKAYNLGIRLNAGGIVVQNMDIECISGICLGIYETADFKATNLIIGSTLTSGGNGCIGFCGTELDFTNNGITVQESTLLVSHETNRVLTATGNSTPGTVTFTYDVHLYSVKQNLATGGYTLAYAPAAITGFSKVTGTATVTLRGVTYEGMTYWSTPAYVPGEIPIAEITNGTTVTKAYTVADIIDSVSSTGNTSIKLLQDVTHTSAITLPYSCTIDFNGYTIQTSLTSGNGINITTAGTSNKVTTLKNGTLVHHTTGLRIGKGGVVVENMTITSMSGACIALLDADPAYKSVNRITNSTLSSAAYYCINFADSTLDYKYTGISIDNSTLISHSTKQQNANNNIVVTGNVIFGKPSASYELGIGNIHFGENVHLYTYRPTPAANNYTRYSGNFPTLDPETRSVTIRGVTYADMNHWSNTLPSTAKTTILAVANSSIFRLVEEVHGICKAGDEEVIIANLYYPACRLDQHLDWYKNDVAGYRDFWITSSLGRFIHNDILTLRGALEYTEWDVIVTHQRLAPENVVGDIRQKTSDQTSKEAQELYSIFREWYPDAELYWQQSWARDVGHASTPDLETQIATYEGMKEISDRVAQENGVIQILGGDAFQLARANPNITEDPTHTDHAHDGYSTGGQYMLGCVWYETLFRKSCAGNPWRPSDYALEEDLITELQKVAHQVVVDAYGEDYVN